MFAFKVFPPLFPDLVNTHVHCNCSETVLYSELKLTLIPPFQYVCMSGTDNSAVVGVVIHFTVAI